MFLLKFACDLRLLLTGEAIKLLDEKISSQRIRRFANSLSSIDMNKNLYLIEGV